MISAVPHTCQATQEDVATDPAQLHHVPESCMRKRVCVICSPAAQSTVIELLEESGLPPICVAMADASNADVTLGKVLVTAVKVCSRPNRCDGPRPPQTWGLRP